MQKNIFILTFLLLTIFTKAQTFKIDTLRYNGDINKRINIVLLGDGYTATEQTKFITDVTKISNYILNLSPYKQYQNYFNVFAIEIIATESGVSHPGTATDVTEPVIPVSKVNNYFNTSFDSYSIHRLIVANNTSAINAVLAKNFPNYDLAMVVGNSIEYGGSGGTFPTISVNADSPEIAAHELGHSFADLSDEYWTGYPAEKPNMTTQSDPALIKWKAWIGIKGIGIYPYGNTAPESQWFRPHQNCKMQFLGVAYCSVCAETIIEKIHQLSNPIDFYFPSDTTTTISAPLNSMTFKSTLLKPNPNTLKQTWKLNNTDLAKNIDSISINNTDFINGNNTVSLTVIDTNTLSKSVQHPTLHTYSVIWKINKTVSGINEVNNIISLNTFPNPATHQLNIKYTVQDFSSIGFNLMNSEGKKVKSIRTEKHGNGEYEQKLDLTDLPEGIYFLQCIMDKSVILNKILVTK